MELPADFGYKGPQRVCVSCAPTLEEVQEKAKDLELSAKFYLRGCNAGFGKSLSEIGLFALHCIVC